jgi:hypothetical protein
MTTDQRTGTAFATALCGLALTLGLVYAIASGNARMTRSVRELDRAAIADRAAALRERHDRLQHEIQFVEHFAVQLAAGTLSLTDATARIEPILRTRPDFDITCQVYYHTPNMHLGTARYLIIKVQQLLDADESQWLIVSARLEAEYAEMK